MAPAWLSNLLQRIRLVVIGEDDQEDEGQGLVEYALILILVSITAIILVGMLGPDIGNIFSNIITHL